MATAYIPIDPDADRALSAMVEALDHLARSRDDRFSSTGVAGRLNSAALAAIRIRYGTTMDEFGIGGQEILDRAIDGKMSIGAAVVQLEHEAKPELSAGDKAADIIEWVQANPGKDDKALERIMWCGGPDVWTALVEFTGCDPERDDDDVICLGGYRQMLDAVRRQRI